MRAHLQNTRRQRLEARVTEEQKRLLQRAADLSGRSLSDFVVSSAQAAAEEAVRAHEVMQPTDRETQAFVEAFLSGSQPNEVLRRHARRHRAVVRAE